MNRCPRSNGTSRRTVVLLEQQAAFAKVIAALKPVGPAPIDDSWYSRLPPAPRRRRRCEVRCRRCGSTADVSAFAGERRPRPFAPSGLRFRPTRFARRAAASRRCEPLLALTGSASARSHAAMNPALSARDADDVAVGLDDVGDRRADDRLFRRHVFERLRRADEPRRFVQSERQHANVPAGHEGRQVLISRCPK